MSTPVVVTTYEHEEEFYSYFIRIEQGDHTALVFNHDASDAEWAGWIAGFLRGVEIRWYCVHNGVTYQESVQENHVFYGSTEHGPDCGWYRAISRV